MKFVEKLKEKFKEKRKDIRIRGELSGASWLEAHITSLNQEPITFGTSTENVKIRLQTLISGALCFSQGDYRIDSHTNKNLHEHTPDSENQLEILTVSGALVKVLENC